ncbi:MAG: hypothetical protein AAF465_15875 [Pseudomonadota bacterium]
MSSRVARLILGLGVAPLASAIPVTICVAIIYLAFPVPEYGFGPWAFISIVAIAISYVCTLVFGLPAYFALSYFGVYSRRNVALVGFFVALIPSSILLSDAGNWEDVLFSILYVACAITVSLVFGTITDKS